MLNLSRKSLASLTVLLALTSCASLFPSVVKIGPNLYVIGGNDDSGDTGMTREERITVATAFCTGQRSSMTLVPNPKKDADGNPIPSAQVRFQCIYFPNDSE